MPTDNLTLIWESETVPLNLVERIVYSEDGWLALLGLLMLPLVVGILVVIWWPHHETLPERIIREERRS